MSDMWTAGMWEIVLSKEVQGKRLSYLKWFKGSEELGFRRRKRLFLRDTRRGRLRLIPDRIPIYKIIRRLSLSRRI